MTNLTRSFVVCYIFAVLSCSNNNNSINHQAANPFDTTQLVSQSLSDNEKKRLLQAQGKEAQTINNAQLLEKIANASEMLSVFCFWNMDNPESIKTMKAVNTLAAQYDSTRIKFNLIHVSNDINFDNLNLFIRENQLTEAVYTVKDFNKVSLGQTIKKDIEASQNLPLVVMTNKTEGLTLLYNKVIDEAELNAIVQPLVVQ